MGEPPDGDGGSTLLLVPSAVLVLFLLTALALDGAATFLAQRELADVCAGAANDAAAAALDVDRLYSSQPTPARQVDPQLAAEIVRSRLNPLETRWGHPISVTTGIDGPTVRLRLATDVPLPIGPGGASTARAHVTATCSATTIRR